MIGELLSLGCALVWGLSVVLFKSVESVSPLGVNLFKNVAGVILFAATILVGGIGIDWARSTEDWIRLAVSGAIGLSAADTVFLAALRRLGAARLAILDCGYGPLVVVLSLFLLHEPLGAGFLLGGGLVTGGVIAVVLEGAPREVGSVVPGAAAPAPVEHRPALPDYLLGGLSIVLMALAIVIAKPAIDRSASVVEVTFVRLVVGTLVLIVGVLPSGSTRAALGVFRPQAIWRRLIPTAILGTYVSMLLWLGGIKYTTVTVASVLNQFSVVFTLFFAWLFLREKLTPGRIAGGTVAFAGALVILLWR
jgi:drug/metabolite transporter (DMT)-like permease